MLLHCVCEGGGGSEELIIYCFQLHTLRQEYKTQNYDRPELMTATALQGPDLGPVHKE